MQIYNEQITDLLDPNQKNLQVISIMLLPFYKSSLIVGLMTDLVFSQLFCQIREDVKSGIYVENLTEECVRTMEDVNKLLMKVCYLILLHHRHRFDFFCFV